LNLENLSKIEKKTYDFIREAGDIQTRNLPDKRMVGAVASLKNKGVVEIYKRYSSTYRRKKKKFVKVRIQQNDRSCGF
jgi:hypothetical protein